MHRLNDLPSADRSGKAPKVPVANTEVGGSLQKWTMPDVELALQVLALNGGNSSKTSAILESEHNLNVPAQTIRKWAKTQFTNRYNIIQHELRNTISQDLASKLTENAQRSAEITETLLDSLSDDLDGLEPTEKSRVAKDVSQIGSTSIDKSLLLRGQPTDISVAMKPEEIVAELQRMAVKVDNEEPIEEE